MAIFPKLGISPDDQLQRAILGGLAAGLATLIGRLSGLLVAWPRRATENAR